MATLFADRFARCGAKRAIDIATGKLVSLRVRDAGTRDEQQAWAHRCAASLGVDHARTLVDFGLIGQGLRFEAHRAGVRSPAEPAGECARLRAAATQVVDWIENGASTSNVLRVLSAPGWTLRWLEGVVRDLRLQGCVCVDISTIQRHPDMLRSLAGRSVVVFDERGGRETDDTTLCLSILKVFAASARSVSAVTSAPRAKAGSPFLDVEFPRAGQIAHAAERRPVYGASRHAPLVVDRRSAASLDEGRQFMRYGRHAPAERALRAAAAGFDRRGDRLHLADALMSLGHLLLVRGRPAAAEVVFSKAREHFQEMNAAQAAISAWVCTALAQTDDGQFDRSNTTARAALTAAHALGNDATIHAAGVALARNLCWQKRWAEGLQVLQAVPHRDCPRYWGLRAKLHLAAGRIDTACECASLARTALSANAAADADVVVRIVLAAIQARLGDVDALVFHVRAGLASARAAHRPLHALRLRLTLIEGLLDAGLAARARALGRAAGAFRKATLPRPLRERVDRVLERLAAGGPNQPRKPVVSLARETAADFLPDYTDAVAGLLSACHAVEDERAALRSVAEIVRKRTGATAVGIFGAASAEPVKLALVGSMDSTMARRCVEIAQPMAPERSPAGMEGAAPVVHLGRLIGAVACRWTVEGPRDAQDAITFARISAAACAPLLQIILEREGASAQDGGGDGLEIIGVSGRAQEVRTAIARAARAPFTVLIEGESGAGKELVARAIHRAGSRRGKVFQALNCAALTDELVDSELFGHARGAFTGAVAERLGLFESADGGTVFLDEVGELSSRAQAKLLRTLQEGEIRRIGESFTRPIDARLIAATNRSLAAEVQAGRFRQDLLYRLDVIRVTVPPLRERVEDIPLLACRFWSDAVERIGSKAVLGQAALAALARYDWPGNVRELQNVLASLAVSVPSRGVVPASAMPAAIAHTMKPVAGQTLDAARRHFEERFVRAALARAAGHRGQTASALGVSRQGLAKLMHRLQLS